jgi:hypothetical protein
MCLVPKEKARKLVRTRRKSVNLPYLSLVVVNPAPVLAGKVCFIEGNQPRPASTFLREFNAGRAPCLQTGKRGEKLAEAVDFEPTWPLGQLPTIRFRCEKGCVIPKPWTLLLSADVNLRFSKGWPVSWAGRLL